MRCTGALGCATCSCIVDYIMSARFTLHTLTVIDMSSVRDMQLTYLPVHRSSRTDHHTSSSSQQAAPFHSSACSLRLGSLVGRDSLL